MLQLVDTFDAATPEGRERVRSSFERNLQGLIEEAAAWGIVLSIDVKVQLPSGSRQRIADARHDRSNCPKE